jgi:hypothetical protein
MISANRDVPVKTTNNILELSQTPIISNRLPSEHGRCDIDDIPHFKQNTESQVDSVDQDIKLLGEEKHAVS